LIYTKTQKIFIRNFFHKIENQFTNRHIYIFLFFAIWLCIDTNFDNILALKKQINFKNLLTSIRAIAPFVLFIIFIFNLFNEKKNFPIIKKNIFNKIILVFLIYFILQFPGLIFTNNNILNSYYLFISLISILLILKSFNENFTVINYQICLFVLSLLVCIYGLVTYKWFFLDTINLNFYGTYPAAYIYMYEFSTNVIRSSGLARSAMILIIPLILLILIKKINLYSLIPFLFLSSLVYLTQSRVVIFFYVIFVTFLIIFYLRNKNIKYKISKIFILLLLPIIFSNLIIFSKEIIRTTNFDKIYKSFKYKITHNAQYKQLNHYYVAPNLELHEYRYVEHKFYVERLVRPVEPKSFSSNRTTYWKNVISNSERPFFGYGTLGDRFLINHNSSNAFIYAYASGGFISVLLLIIIFARYVFLSIKLVLIDKIVLNKKNLVILSSIFTICFLMYRSLVEVGIAVFSIDFMLFLTCITVCEKSISQKYSN